MEYILQYSGNNGYLFFLMEFCSKIMKRNFIAEEVTCIMKTLLFLGDSITDCCHNYDTDNLGEGYVRMIAEKLGYGFGKVKVINKGIDGFTVSGVNRLWMRDSKVFSPDVITILIGINDVGVMKNTFCDPEFALQEFKMNYQLLIQRIREIFDGPIILMEPFIFPCPEEYKTWEPEVAAMNEIIKNLAKQYNLVFISLWDRLLLAADKISYQKVTTDGIHLTDLGHMIITEAWLDAWERI